MGLGTEQERFTLMAAQLVISGSALGYGFRSGDAFRDSRLHGKIGEKKGYGHKDSCHKLKLAKDFYISKDDVYLQGDAAKAGHNELHDIWDGLGGAERIKHDLNHYSLGWKGMR